MQVSPDASDDALYMLVADGEVRAAGTPAAIAWCRRGELGLGEEEAFWVRLGQLAGRERYAAVRIGDARASGAAAFRPARRAGFVNLFQLGRCAPAERQLAARALHLGAWLHRSRFCGSCGQAAAYCSELNKRVCQNLQCGAESYPRIEPAVIALVVCGSRCLLARQDTFPAGYFAPIAGFVEAGETPEQAVRREVLEEVGLALEGMAYAGAQPWPFPGSLMLAYIAEAKPGQAMRLSKELELAKWVERDELGTLMLPPPGVIGRTLIEEWLARAS